jgi:histidinol-phosphate/aromatic aminotransferase/cobyric acid decarboxylase-like protein
MALPAVDSIRSEVRSLQPYVPGKPIEVLQRELGIADAIKLASNENPLGPSPLALRAMVGEAAARASLGDPDQVSRSRDLNAAGLDYYRTELPALGLTLTPSWANFVLAKFPRSALEISRALEHEGVIIRPMVSFGLAPEYARVSVGTAAENERLVEVLRRIA